MDNRYKVIENRGFGIEYSYRENLILNDAVELSFQMNLKAENGDEALQNGNNDPFEYRVEPE
jgi:hypothetical protein